jgi:hypothetical protein
MAQRGINLPRNLKIKKNEDGTFNIFMIKAKLTIPLRCLEKKEVLTPSMVRYLSDYESRLQKDDKGKIVDTKTLERIRTILSKPRLDRDPILDKDMKVAECRYTEAHHRRMGYKGYEDFKVQKDADDKRVAELKEKNEKARQEQEKKNANTKK